METPAPYIPSAASWRLALKHIVGEWPFYLALLALLLASAFFWFLPDVDLDTSELFYRRAGGFFLAHDQELELVRRIGIDLSWAYGLLAIGLVLAGLVLRAYRGEFIRRAVFLIGVMLLGPGLLVNLVLKDNWGRARPRDLIEFGGTLPYSKVWEIVPYCRTNCSFVSGEAAAAFARPSSEPTLTSTLCRSPFFVGTAVPRPSGTFPLLPDITRAWTSYRWNM